MYVELSEYFYLSNTCRSIDYTTKYINPWTSAANVTGSIYTPHPACMSKCYILTLLLNCHLSSSYVYTTAHFSKMASRISVCTGVFVSHWKPYNWDSMNCNWDNISDKGHIVVAWCYTWMEMSADNRVVTINLLGIHRKNRLPALSFARYIIAIRLISINEIHTWLYSPQWSLSNCKGSPARESNIFFLWLMITLS